MNNLKITLHVDSATAIRAGHAMIGTATLSLTDADMLAMTPSQRDTLARHIDGENLYKRPLTDCAPPIANATLDVLAMLLDVRAAWVAAELAREEVARKAREESYAKANREETERKAARDAEYDRLQSLPIAEFALLRGKYNEVLGHGIGSFRQEELARYDAENEATQHAAELALVTKYLPESAAVFAAKKAHKNTIHNARRVAMIDMLKPCSFWAAPLNEHDAREAEDADEMSPSEFERYTSASKAVLAVIPDAKISAFRPWREAREDEEGDKDNEVPDLDTLCISITAEICGGRHEVSFKI